MSTKAGTTLGALAESIGASLVRGSASDVVSGIGTLESATAGQVSFYSNAAYRPQLASTRAKAVIASAADADLPELRDRTVLVATTPYAAFARASRLFHPETVYRPGVDPRAVVEEGARVDPTAHVAPFAVVKAGATVGARAALLSFSYVGENASIGEGTVLWPNAVVRDECIVGARCVLHPGSVVGADGFGFAFDPEGDGEGPIHRKVPQVGIARLEDDVELGANTCIDRAALGETVVGRGSKLDNMVQVAHNVKIGPMCVIAAQSGIAGSTTIGMGAAIGGQTGVVGHISVGDFVRIGAKSAAMKDVSDGETVMGTPAVEAKAWRRMVASWSRLPELVRQVRELRGRLTALETSLGRSTEDGAR